jgi:hypothetical protein
MQANVLPQAIGQFAGMGGFGGFGGGGGVTGNDFNFSPFGGSGRLSL